MIELDGNDLNEMLISTREIEYSNINFNIETPLNIDINKITLKNKFINCKFKGHQIDFLNLNIAHQENEIHILNFENCDFDNEIFFKDCSLQELKISKFQNINKFHIACKKISYLIIENDEKAIIEDFNLTLHNCEVTKELSLRNIKTNTGYVDFISCNLNLFTIFNCKIERLDISKSTFNKTFEFHKNEISESYIKNCNFSKFYFIKNNLNGCINLKYNNFNETTLVEKNENDIRGEFNIVSCDFNKYTYFNNNNLFRIIIDTSKFAETTSFQDVNIDEFKLDKTIFEKTPFFDDFSIKMIDRCTYRTIRNLKQQLLRADNSIDYNFYRAIEHTIYKKHLKTKINKSTSKVDKTRLKRDLIILKINDFFSDNGVNWAKAIKRTLFFSFLIYVVFYISYNFQHSFDLKSFNKFTVGYFKFLLVTDYHNPLIEEKKHIDLWYAWIPFIIGKIFIGIGIYEIIVSFRKFKK
ncbi:hypothetical protein [Chryseobacterium polytrichastri]|uniref:Pentapeptide repeat-containing protein n=1 Tax=Chryseobacterium polytrichastri TaxID=1302687 RepID=A0A1M7HYL3_9FLAO|nr:hypothetical protein [Chryseobacterium polytrichastri]SHM33641.1 hypothetical protein SAMN05444267_104312 [Chryseobacterium polytrichastri]